MDSFVAWMQVGIASSASFSILGGLLATIPLAWSFAPKDRAWFLRNGSARRTIADGHGRGFSALRRLRIATPDDIAVVERQAQAAERARAWIARLTWPFIPIGVVNMIAAVVTVAVASNLPTADPSWWSFYIGLYVFGSLSFIAPLGWYWLLQRLLLPEEYIGALLVADSAMSLTASRRTRSFLGSAVTRSLRPLERAARRATLRTYGSGTKPPNTANIRALASATKELGRFGSGASVVAPSTALTITWQLGSVWRLDSAERIWSPAPTIRWGARNRVPVGAVWAASPLGALVVGVVIDLAVTLIRG